MNNAQFIVNISTNTTRNGIDSFVYQGAKLWNEWGPDFKISTIYWGL